MVSAHREENINSDNFIYLVETLNTIAEKYQLPIIISTHPRTKKMIEEKGIRFHKLIQTLKPLGFIDYNKLQLESKVVLSDSGTISEESSILKFNALNIREAHVRPEAMEEAVVIMSGLKKDRVLQALTYLGNGKQVIPDVNDYTISKVSEKVVRIILSNLNYVN